MGVGEAYPIYRVHNVSVTEVRQMDSRVAYIRHRFDSASRCRQAPFAAVQVRVKRRAAETPAARAAGIAGKRGIHASRLRRSVKTNPATYTYNGDGRDY